MVRTRPPPLERMWLRERQLGLNLDTATFDSMTLGKLLSVPERQFSPQ